MLHDIEAAGGHAFKFFALAILAVHPEQYHSGMLYETTDGQLMLLHLADNFDLRNEAPHSRYKWGLTSLPKSTCKFLAVLCAKIASQEPRLPYGFERTGISIERMSGKVTFGVEGKGFTCASFIMAVLEAYGLRLLREDEWPLDAHISWQNSMIEHFRTKGNASQEQLDALQQQTGACRFVPQEVVGASTAKPWPVGYDKATALGIEVQSYLID